MCRKAFSTQPLPASRSLHGSTLPRELVERTTWGLRFLHLPTIESASEYAMSRDSFLLVLSAPLARRLWRFGPGRPPLPRRRAEEVSESVAQKIAALETSGELRGWTVKRLGGC